MRLHHALILTSVASFLASNALAATQSFRDVPSTHENAEAIAYVKTQGIVSGYSDGTYRPDQTINRAEFTKIIIGSRFAKSQIDLCIATSSTIAPSFPDVSNKTWFAPFVCMAKRHSIAAGYPDGTYKPEQTINFAEASKILAVAYNFPLANTPVWYEGFVRALADKKAIPLSIGGFDALLTRGEMAEIIFRLQSENMDKESHTYESIGTNTAECVPAGCSGQLCVDADEAGNIVTTCEWREEYGCYDTATCERQTNGECDWTQTPELTSCLGAASSQPPTLFFSASSRASAATFGSAKSFASSLPSLMEVYEQLSSQGGFIPAYNANVIGNGQTSILYFHASWCPVCYQMNKKLETWYKDGVGVVPIYRVDFDTETALRTKYEVTIQHTLVVVDGTGEMIDYVYYPTDDEILELISGQTL